jgi:hypothetical protein
VNPADVVAVTNDDLSSTFAAASRTGTASATSGRAATFSASSWGMPTSPNDPALIRKPAAKVSSSTLSIEARIEELQSRSTRARSCSPRVGIWRPDTRLTRPRNATSSIVVGARQTAIAVVPGRATKARGAFIRVSLPALRRS